MYRNVVLVVAITSIIHSATSSGYKDWRVEVENTDSEYVVKIFRIAVLLFNYVLLYNIFVAGLKC